MPFFRFKNKPEHPVCFEIGNFDQACSNDPSTLQHLEETLARAGALPLRVDAFEGIFCVEVTNPDLSTEEMSEIFTRFGFQSGLKV